MNIILPNFVYIPEIFNIIIDPYGIINSPNLVGLNQLKPKRKITTWTPKKTALCPDTSNKPRNNRNNKLGLCKFYAYDFDCPYKA